MAVTQKVIIPPKQAEDAQTTQYTATSVKTLIDKFTATNTSASPVDLSINLVTSAGTAADDNLILDAKTIAAGEVYTCPEVVGHSLDNGDFISTLASVASVLTIRASGREIT